MLLYNENLMMGIYFIINNCLLINGFVKTFSACMFCFPHSDHLMVSRDFHRLCRTCVHVVSKTTFKFFILTFYWIKVSPNTITSRQRWMQLKCFRKQILCAKKSLYSATRKKSQRNINNSGRVLIRSCKGLETLLKRRNSNLLYATTEEQSLSMSGNP